MLEGNHNTTTQISRVLKQYQNGAEFYLCSHLRKNIDGKNAQFTPSKQKTSCDLFHVLHLSQPTKAFEWEENLNVHNP